MFSENLNKIIQAQKISHKELSQLSGISQSTISKFLSGDQEPKYSHILSIADAIQIPPELFMSSFNSLRNLNPPSINEFFMVREIYNDKYANLHISSLYAFKEFTFLVPLISEDALYIVVILEGRTDSKLGTLRAGDYDIRKGIEFKGLEVTVYKGTKNIVFIMHESLGNTSKSWSKIFFDDINRQQHKFLK